MQLEQEVGKLKKQLQSVRSKLLQSEQRETEAQMQIEELQQSLAAQKTGGPAVGGRVRLALPLGMIGLRTHPRTSSSPVD